MRLKTIRILSLAWLVAGIFQAGPIMTKATTWTGAASADWIEAGNWDSGGCAGDPFPEDGDTINFDSNSAANLTMNNDLSLVFGVIAFETGSRIYTKSYTDMLEICSSPDYSDNCLLSLWIQ